MGPTEPIQRTSARAGRRVGSRAKKMEASRVRAAWLGEQLLVVLVWHDVDPAVALSAEFEVGGVAVEDAPEVLVLPAAPEGESTRILGMVRVPGAGATGTQPPSLRVEFGKDSTSFEGEEMGRAVVDLRTMIRENLAALDAATRNQIVSWLPQAASIHLDDDDDGGYSLSRNLQLAHEALRDRRAPCVVAPEEPRGIQIDTLLGVDRSMYWIKGWALDADARITGLTAVSPEGGRAEFLDRSLWFDRPDVKEFYGGAGIPGFGNGKSGFVGLVELPAPSRLGAGWNVELTDAMGVSVEVEVPPAVREPLAVRATILGDFELAKRPDDPARADLFEPALSRLQERLAGDVEVEDVRQHGVAPSAPEVSIIVPLYRRIDFLEHQLTQFAVDPQMREADLIYVLDSPEDADALERLAPEIHALTGVPFRIVTLARNSGFSAANNTAAQFARADKLLLLNSDVIPDRPGWLGTMCAFFDATPEIGALAPKLLYEDDSLQHAGLYFLRAPGSPVWENMHYFKGLNRFTGAANVARRVPAVTGACMMVERERYEQLGGLRGQFVQGDYEDSDLCLRLQEMGFGIWYLPDAELYHLEAQSYPGELRRTTTAYNTWLHSHTWDEQIAEIMDELSDEVLA